VVFTDAASGIGLALPLHAAYKGRKVGRSRRRTTCKAFLAADNRTRAPGAAWGSYTAPPSRGKEGGKLPLNTNGGELSYIHSGMYGMYALQESVRQMRGIAAAQIPGVKVSVCHGVDGWFAASGTIIFSNEA
jgi:hypothetical protein